MPFLSRIGSPIGAAVDGGALTAGSGRLRVEPDQLDGAIAVFKDALDTVESEVGRARNDLDAMPPAKDQVSQDAVDVFNQLGYKNADSAIKAWEGAVLQLRAIVERLEEAKRGIMQADADNSSNFRASS